MLLSISCICCSFGCSSCIWRCLKNIILGKGQGCTHKKYQKVCIKTRIQAFVGAAASAATVAAESAAPSGSEAMSFSEVRSEKESKKGKTTKQTNTFSRGASTTFRKNVLQPLINLLAGKMREKGPWHHTGCGRTRRNFMVDYSLTDKTRGCCSEVRLCSGMVARTCKEVANGRTRLHWVSEARDSHTMTNENVDKIYVCQCFEHRSALFKEAGFQETCQNKHWSDVSPVA